MNLSPNFTLAEMERSQEALRKGIDNSAPPAAVSELKRLCDLVLEPVRALLDVPLHTDSGFRCKILNALVGSTASHSAHLDGRAWDGFPIGMDLREAFDRIRASQIPFDRLIVECNAWLHIAVAAEGVMPLREVLEASGTPGHWIYTHV